MSEKEIRKYPECAGEMEEGDRLTFQGRWPILEAVKLTKKEDFYGDKIIPLYCKKCGSINHKEMKKE